MLAKEVNDALEQVLPVLVKHNIEVLAIGGLAVGHYGYNRISGGPVQGDIKADLDFWYKPTTENYVNLVKALKDLDVDVAEIERKAFDPKKSSSKFLAKISIPISFPRLSVSIRLRHARKIALSLHLENTGLL